MEIPDPRVRLRLIALTGLAIALICSLSWGFLGGGSLSFDPRAALQGVVVGLLVGLLHGVLANEIPARVQALGPQHPLARGVRYGLPMIAMAIMMTVLMAKGPAPGGILFVLFIPIGLGVGLIAAGHAVRRGESRHCPKCDYEFAFASEGDAPLKCPECGTGWLGRLAVGRRQGSPLLKASGIGVLAATAVLVAGMFTGGPFARALPTPLLLTWARAAQSVAGSSVWAELGTRTLSQAERDALATRLLDIRRDRDFSLGVGAKDWLDAQIGAAGLSADVQERFFSEMFRGELDVPRRVRVGEPFEVGFRKTRSKDGFTYKLFMYIGGFGLDGQGPPTAGRQTKGFYPNLIDRSRSQPYDDVSATLTATRPGVVTLRANLWLMVQTGFPAEITWNDDGTPTIPPTAAWVKQAEMTREIEVDP